MRKFTRKCKSKKAFTLVELVVTIAILSITATMGVGIFAATLRNYSRASVTAKEQENATEIQRFIYSYGRIGGSVFFIDPTSANDEINETDIIINNKDILTAENKSTGYIVLDPDTHKLAYKLNARDLDGNLIDSPEMYVNGVEKVEFQIIKNKLTSEDADTDQTMFFTLNYKIVMVENYSLKGSIVLLNSKNLTTNVEYTNSYIETIGDVFTIGGDESYTRGIGFYDLHLEDPSLSETPSD